MATIESILQPYLNVSHKELIKFEQFFKKEHLKKGEFFLRKGKLCDRLSFIESGYIRFFSSIDDKEITHWVFYDTQLITDLTSITLGTPAKWNIQAISDCTIYTILKRDYEKLSLEEPKWAAFEKKLLVKCYSLLENRVFSFLSMPAQKRYETLYKANSQIFNQIPLIYIASMLGITPETLSRLRKKSIS